MSILIQHPKQLNQTWARAVLKQYSAEAEVEYININTIDIGTTTRISVTVKHNLTHLPIQWFVKLPSLMWRARIITALPRLLATEIAFYQQLATQLPLNLPNCLAAKSQFGRGSILVLSDVKQQKARAGQTSDALSFNQAQAVLAQLAQLHAIGQRRQIWQYGLNNHFIENALGDFLAVPLMRNGLRLAGIRVPKRLHDSALAYARHRRRVQRFLSQGELTLVHHDCHAGNLFWHEQKAGLLDWQMLRLGEGISDVAYLLAVALNPDTREHYEHALLDYYLEQLHEKGGYCDRKTIFKRYQAHLCYALDAMLMTLAIGGMMDINSNLELIRRSALAVEQHQAFNLLPL